MELLFLSFTNLSSTGLSDVVPIKPFARSLVMIEQLAGLAYIAMVVSRLVGLLVLSRAPSARRLSSRPSGRWPISRPWSARITCITALISARWVKACGKLPRWRPERGSISSA